MRTPALSFSPAWRSAMSKTCLCVSMCVLLALSAAANAQEPAKANVRKLIVSGSATLQVKPDAARITFVVLSKQFTGNEARAENERQVKQIKESLQAVKAKNADIHTQPASL